MPAFRKVSAFALGLLASTLLRADFILTAPKGTFAANATLTLQKEDFETRTKSNILQSTTATDGSLNLTVDSDPALLHLSVGDSQSILLLPEPKATIQLSLDPQNSDTLLTSGSPSSQKAQAYDRFRKESLARLVYPVRADIKEAKADDAPAARIESLTRDEIEAYKQHLHELNAFTIDQVGQSLALYATSLRWDGDFRFDELSSLVHDFAASRPESDLSQAMLKRIERLESVAIGAIAPEISAKQLDSLPLSLSSLRGRYVLVDFWASWCPPCRIANRHLKQINDSIPSDRFTVFSVNMDTSEQLWNRASKQDAITWPNVSDLSGLKSDIATSYSVSSLPRSFLLDKEGRIIAKDLSMDDLDDTLQKLGLTN